MLCIFAGNVKKRQFGYPVELSVMKLIQINLKGHSKPGIFQQ
jgi:hypothetical protein